MKGTIQLLTFATTITLAVSPVALAQMPAQKSSTSTQTTEDGASFSPHDLSGLWDFFIGADHPGGRTEGAIKTGQGIYGTPSKDHPPFTAWAQARYDESKPGYGPKAQAGGNDPILQCNPSGIPRILFFPQPHEIVQLPDRMFMFFEREHAWRQIWTDGRPHPKDLELTWMGDSIGHWEGDTFVVDTIGFNDKSWLDFYGDPHSDELHLIERYKRVNRNTLTMQLIVEDPKAYVGIWVGDTKIYKLLTGKEATMEEFFCIPAEENAFTNRIRMPAAGKQPDK